MERRKRTLTDLDLEAIEERFSAHNCRMDLSHEDVVFLKRMNKGANAIAWYLFRGFLGLVFVGMVLLAGFGLFSRAFKGGP